MKKLIALIIGTFCIAMTAHAVPFTLELTYSHTNFAQVTEVRGISEAGAVIAAQDANEGRLFCNKLLGVIGANPQFSCFGLNAAPPITVTANKFFLSPSTKTVNTKTIGINNNSNPWMLTVTESSPFFIFGEQITGTSEQGAAISAVDNNDIGLFCNVPFGAVGEEGVFTCFGFGIDYPVTVTARSGGLFGFLAGRADAMVIYSPPAN